MIGSRYLLQMVWLAIACIPMPGLAAEPDQISSLRIAVGENKPPYVIAHERRGIEVELLRTIMDTAGYKTEVVFIPNKRAQLSLTIGTIDAAIAAGTDRDFLSEPYIAYQNIAITLCSRHIAVDKVGDLAKFRIAAFQNAHLFLGDEFATVAANNVDYREVSPQITINRLIYAQRIDVAISDINVFHSLNRQLGADSNSAQALCTYELFPPTLYRLAFRARDVRDRFNVALKQILQSDYYEALAKRYGMPLVRDHPYFKPKIDAH